MPRRDLLIFQNTRGPNRGESLIRLAMDRGYGVEGIQKIAQMFALLLLTERGSCPTDPDRGTRFYGMAKIGALYDDGLLRAQFAFATLDIIGYLSVKRVELPSSEQLRSAELIDWSSRNGNLRLNVRLTSEAGIGAVYVYPITTGAGP